MSSLPRSRDKRSSIAVRVLMANASIADSKIMGVFVVTFLKLVVAHGHSYVIVE